MLGHIRSQRTTKLQIFTCCSLSAPIDALKQSVSFRSTFSRFSFLVRLLYIKSHYRVSNNYFDALLALLSDAFPSSNVPKSCEEAHKYIRELGQGYESIHVCKNNCVLFWGDCEELQACPKCKESRWEDADGSRQVPHKVLRHFPLIPRLQRIFAARGTAADAEWHETKREKNTGEMSHPTIGRHGRTLIESTQLLQMIQRTWGLPSPQMVSIHLATLARYIVCGLFL